MKVVRFAIFFFAQAVDDQNVPGYQHVDRLAEYPVKLREQTSLCLTNQQSSAIITLWEKLDEGDKQRVIYATQHQGRLSSGRFRTPKNRGTALHSALPESKEPLQEARALPAEPRSARQEHQYQLPNSTAGQTQQRPTASSHPITPKAIVERLVLLMPPAPQIVTATGQTLPHFIPVVLPAPVQGTNLQITKLNTTAESGPPPKRPYRRTVEANTCKRCGQFRTADTGHSQYRGRVYCPAFDTLTKQQWLEEMRKKFSK